MSDAAQQIDTAPPGTDLGELLRDGMRAAQAANAPTWLADVRQRGAERFGALPMPDRKQEAWRYTPVSFLDRASYRAPQDGPFAAVELSDIEDLLLESAPATRLVFVNGHYSAALSAGLAGRGDLEVATLMDGGAAAHAAFAGKLDTVAEHRHVFAALNSALMSDGALIRVRSGDAQAAPIELLHVSVGLDDPAICHPRHLILVEAGARAHVIERYCSLGDSTYFNNALIEVALAEHATLVHERLQQESRHAQHLSDLHVRLAAGSRYRHTLAAFGAAWSRNDIRATFAGEGASAEFDGLLLAQDGQLNDVHLDVDHASPGCTSREDFKGIVDGKGRIVFDGRILVARQAQQTDAMLSNHNLMLSRSAEVDSKPQLEIYADDVKCSHGTTVGELDPGMVFYLRSRGIPEAQARNMLCQGFAEEILSRIAYPALHARAVSLLAARLRGSA